MDEMFHQHFSQPLYACRAFGESQKWKFAPHTRRFHRGENFTNSLRGNARLRRGGRCVSGAATLIESSAKVRFADKPRTRNRFLIRLESSPMNPRFVPNSNTRLSYLSIAASSRLSGRDTRSPPLPPPGFSHSRLYEIAFERMAL